MSERDSYLLGQRQAEADWQDGAANVLALQDPYAFGQGYRAKRRELREASKEPEVTEILMQDRRAPVFKGWHVHTCPECSEHVPCEDACGCFEDMRLEDGTERGGFVVCDVCTERAKSAPSRDVIDLMEALRASLKEQGKP